MNPMKALIFFLFSLCSTCSLAQVVSLNGRWQFKTDWYQQGEQQGWFQPGFQPNGWDEMDVPGNWDLENEYAEFAGTAWYRKSFPTQANWKGQRVRLYFEAVYNDAEVWLNGQKITENHLGFLPFWVDVQEALNPQGNNVLVVKVNNVFKRGAIWNWGGIRRPVWLEITPLTRLERQHITAPPQLSKGHRPNRPEPEAQQCRPPASCGSLSPNHQPGR